VAITDTIIPKNDQSVNMNTGSAKGLEKAISVISTFIIKAQSKLNKIIYGSPRANLKNTQNNKGDVQTAMERGIIPVLDQVAAIDICAINTLQQDLTGLKNIINPSRIIPLLRQILIQANNINSIARKILGYINSARSIVQIIVLLLKVFKLIANFLKTLPVPSLFTIIGVSVTVSDTLQTKINKFVDTTIDRLNQINTVLNLIVIIATSLIAGIDQIILRLKTILASVEACADDQLLADLNSTISNLQDSRDQLQKFLNDYNTNKNQIDKNFGGYRIDIVTEQIVDEGINLRRRYGVARDLNNYIVAQTTPTFASLDLIIINEVKVLLVSKGLVDSSLQTLSTDQVLIVTEALNYLEDNAINIQDIEISPDFTLDSDNIGQNEALGLRTFVDNLKGGKELRKKMRKSLATSIAKLGTNIKESDPTGKFSGGIKTSQ
jgi:hypothetical protein